MMAAGAQAAAGFTCLAATVSFAGLNRAVASDRSSSSCGSYAGVGSSNWRTAVGMRRCQPRTTCLACHKVTLVTPGGEYLVEVQDDESILDAAEKAFPNANLPSSCRTGGCSSCAGRLTSGQVDQNSQTFLDENQIRLGYVLTCVAYPLSDAVIKTHQEEQLY